MQDSRLLRTYIKKKLKKFNAKNIYNDGKKKKKKKTFLKRKKNMKKEKRKKKRKS